MSKEKFQENFRIIVEKIFNNWQNLRLAVEHGMGGRNGQKVAIDIMDYTYQYCVNNTNVTQGELQDVVEDLMDEEFNTLCEDNSIQEICSNLLRYKQMCQECRYDEIESELSKLPQGKAWLNPNVKIAYTPIDADSSSDEENMDGSDGDDDDNMDLDQSDEERYSSRLVTRSQARKQKEKDDFVEPEPGWTTVRSRYKK